jgi:hypothetical protein
LSMVFHQTLSACFFSFFYKTVFFEHSLHSRNAKIMQNVNS